MEQDKYYQPEFNSMGDVIGYEEKGGVCHSFQVWHKKQNLLKDLPLCNPIEYSGNDIEEPTFMDEPEQNSKHTPGELHLSSKLKGDEYSVYILSDKNHPLAIAQYSVYFDIDTAEANAARIVECWNGYNSLLEENKKLKEINGELFQMVKDLKGCINRLTEDGLKQIDRDHEAQWIGEANDLIVKINPNYYQNANA